MDISIGVVEDNNDPEKLGRCKVRMFGLHTEDRTEYPTSDLPWSVYLTNSSNISGQGNFFVPNNGDWVACSFFDPEKQNPMILGVIPKNVVSLPDFTSGFSDPNSINPAADYTDESGISRLARNENITDTIIQDKKDDRTTGVNCNGESWDEPETLYAATYPDNKVIHTKQHVIELDDTSGKERVHIYHKSGTSIEMHPNGDQVDIIKAKRYIVVDSDNNILVTGNYNIKIDTDENKEITGDANTKVGGDSIEDITGDKEINTTGLFKADAGTSAEMKGGTTAKVDAGTSAEIIAGTTISITGGGAVSISSAGAVSITGTTISLN